MNFLSRISSRLFRKSDQRADETSSETEQGASAPEPANAKRELYASDEPISSVEADRFKRSSFAERVAHTIAERRDPNSLVIGIYGPWGDGKTSTLNLMRSTLTERDDIVCVSFNPWHFASDELLLKGFFGTLAGSLNEALPTLSENIGNLLAQYGSVLSLASSKAGTAAKGLGEHLSNVSLEDLHARLDNLLRESCKRVVVMIDDIDRLDRREIQMMLKLVKLSAGFNYTCYVLAFDDQWVAAALGEKYGEGGPAAGRNFLEKIVQVPLHLPRPDLMALREMAFDGVNEAIRISGVELTQEHVDAFVRYFEDGLEPRITTPRQAKLYGNVLSFAIPLLKGEVHTVDQMLVEGLRTFYPNLYKLIRDNPQRFLKLASATYQDDQEYRAETNALIAEAIADSGVPVERASRVLHALFPQLSGTYGSEWEAEWASRKKIASRAYFARYFSYGVPPGDIPDAQLDDLLAEAASSTVDQIGERLKDYGEDRAVGKLVSKLRNVEDQISGQSAKTLALSLAIHARLLPRERGPWLSDHTFRQAAILVYRLLVNVDPLDERIEAAQGVIDGADPLSFALACWYWFRGNPNATDDPEFAPPEAVATLGDRLVARIQAAWESAPLYVTYGQDAPNLLWFWNEHGDHETVEQLLNDRFAQHPAEVDALLDCYVGWAWGMDSGTSHRSDFERNNYDAVTALINGETIFQNLRARFGDELHNATYHHGNDVPFARRVAHQFADIHHHVLNEHDDHNGDSELEDA